MKNLKFIAVATAGLALTALTGCSSAKYKIGILLPVEHSALQECQKGFAEAIEEAKLDVTFEVRNAGGKDAELISYGKDLVSSCNMTFGLGTGAAQSLKSASIDKGIIKPVLFSAVTDPVGASLVEKLTNGKGFCTGTTDAQPISEQIELIKEIIPEADKIGILYTQSEINSKVQADQAKEAAIACGMSVSIQTVTGPSDINATALALASVEGMDAIYIPTDNNIAANMNAVKEAANSKKVLVIAGEEGMLKNGGHVTLSVDYKELGRKTGNMAVQIIKGEKKAMEIPVEGMKKEECKYLYSSNNLAGAGITLPQSFLDRAENVDE